MPDSGEVRTVGSEFIDSDGLRIRRVPVQSETDSKIKYTVTIINDLPRACTCLRFHFQSQRDSNFRNCKHMDKAV